MFSIIYEPVHGIIYKNSKKEKRVMRHSEIHKFCDATLNRVLEGLKSYNNDVKYGYVQRELTNDEIEYLKLFKEEIENVPKPRETKPKSICEVLGAYSGEKDDEYPRRELSFVAQAPILKIITKNKRLKAIRNSLENELRELKDKLSTLEKNKGVDIDCAKCHTLKIENEKLKEESTRLNKFEKSTHCLNEMLNNQKPSGDKLGLGFNSFEASSSGTKEIKFVKAQKKTSSDGGPINMGGPLNVQAAPKINMGPPPATPGSEKKCLEASASLNTKDYLTKFDPKSYEGSVYEYAQNSKAYIILNKHTRKIKESLNVTFDETPPPSKTSPLVDDDLDEEEAIREIKKKNLENIVEDETLEIDEIVNIKDLGTIP
ncbi:hypothetical protein Tco_1509675 [Tanacetum coccineum]